MDDHAQYEFRQYANVIGYEVVSRWCPLVWEAFLDYRFNAITLASFEIELVNEIINNREQEVKSSLLRLNLITTTKKGIKVTNEGQEFLVKVERLGLLDKLNSLIGQP